MYDLIVLGYATNYLPIFTELESKKNVYLTSPFWNNQRELLHFLLRMNLAQKKEKSGFPYHQSGFSCYIFFRDWYPLFASGHLKRLKEKDPYVKACWFFSDLVDTYPGINIERMQREFDLILSFDPEDAKRYNFVYCPLPYSVLPEATKWQQQAVRSDVFFMGSAKQRLETIFAVYERLRNANLSCDFHIVGTSIQDRRYANEINYCEFLLYADYLKKALSSRCILEILQKTTHHGFTARTGEALAYGRKLLSNNTDLINASFYNPKQIGVFSNPKKINIDFIIDDWQPACTPTAFSPINTLKLIEKHLNIKFSVAKSLS